MVQKHWKTQLVKSLKIAAAAALSIGIAGELGLKYSATAGIITILSIRDTRRETLKSAADRALAFLCAVVISACCFRLFGYNLPGFAIYLFLFAMLCLEAGWAEAIAMDSVLVTHFMTEQSMAPGLLANEALLFGIGTIIGILVNLHLHRKTAVFDRLAEDVDSQIKGILHRMSLWLPKEDKAEYGPGCFEKLQSALEAARRCAMENVNNTLFAEGSRESFRELDYIDMRGRQCVILRDIYENILRVEYLPRQAGQVAEFLAQIEQDYHRNNTVEELLEKQKQLLAQMKSQKLPENREEFEARAILFHILMQLKSLLELKRNFVQNMSMQQNNI